MSKLLKFLAVVVTVVIAISLTAQWYQTYVVGAYYTHSGIGLAILGAIAPIVLIGGAIWLIIMIVKAKIL